MRVLSTFAIVMCGVLTIPHLCAQKSGSSGGAVGGGNTGGSTGGNTGGNTGGGNTGSQTPRGNSSTFPTETTRPIFISGTVVMADGTALPGPVVIQRVCSGMPHSEGHTDPKGHFSIQLGASQELSMDLSEPTSFSNRADTFGQSGMPNQGIRQSDLTNCELRASLAGYRSDAVSLFDHRSMDNPNIGTIVLHSLANVQGLTVSAISARAPKDAKKAYEKGLDFAKKNKLDPARESFEQAVATYPKYATAWLELGKVHERQEHPELARNAYAKALEADSKFANPYEQLYMMAFREAKWQELADTTDRVIHLNPFDFPSAYYFNGVANLELNHLDVAEKSAREAVKVDTLHRNAKTNYVLGIILARNRKYAESSEFLKAYLKAVPNASDADVVKKQLVQLETAMGAPKQ